MGRFVLNSELLDAMNAASRHGRAPSSLDSVARILEVEVGDIQRQAHNLAYRTQDPGARQFLEGKRRRRV